MTVFFWRKQTCRLHAADRVVSVCQTVRLSDGSWVMHRHAAARTADNWQHGKTQCVFKRALKAHVLKAKWKCDRGETADRLGDAHQLDLVSGVLALQPWRQRIIKNNMGFAFVKVSNFKRDYDVWAQIAFENSLTSATHISLIWSAVYCPSSPGGSVSFGSAADSARRPPPSHSGKVAARPRASEPAMLALTANARMPGVWNVGLPARSPEFWVLVETRVETRVDIQRRLLERTFLCNHDLNWGAGI